MLLLWTSSDEAESNEHFKTGGGAGIETLLCAFLGTASHRHGLQVCIDCGGSGNILNKADNARVS